MLTTAQQQLAERLGMPARCADCRNTASHECPRCHRYLCDAHLNTHESTRQAHDRCYWSRAQDRDAMQRCAWRPALPAHGGAACAAAKTGTDRSAGS